MNQSIYGFLLLLLLFRLVIYLLKNSSKKLFKNKNVRREKQRKQVNIILIFRRGRMVFFSIMDFLLKEKSNLSRELKIEGNFFDSALSAFFSEKLKYLNE